jgi:hypothetical protein
MRRVKHALSGSLALLTLAAGCPREERPRPQDATDCRFTVLRTEIQVLAAWREGARVETSPCLGRSWCAAAEKEVLARHLSEEVLLIQVGEAHFERPALARHRRMASSAGIAHLLPGRGGALLLFEDHLELLLPSGASERFAWPALAPGERVWAPLVVPGGAGLILTSKRRDEALSRPFLWLREPPGQPARPAGSRPFRTSADELGWLLPTTRGWELELPGGERRALPWPKESRPQVWADEEQHVAWSKRRLVATRAEASYEVALDDDKVFGMRSGVYLLARARGLFRVGASALEPVLPRQADKDLVGAQLPPGAFVERVLAASDGEARLAVVERVRLAGCRVEDRVYEIALPDGKATTLARGERVRLHPAYSLGQLVLVEADAHYEVMNSQ